MTRIEALRTLVANVEAGEYDGAPFNWSTNKKVFHAYHGSLEAAKALHEAVLPGRFRDVLAWHQFPMYRVTIGNVHEGVSSVEARAWLLSILKTLIAEEEKI